MPLPVSATDPLTQWFEQAGAQHVRGNYLSPLGTAAVACASSSTTAKAAAADAG